MIVRQDSNNEINEEEAATFMTIITKTEIIKLTPIKRHIIDLKEPRGMKCKTSKSSKMSSITVMIKVSTTPNQNNSNINSQRDILEVATETTLPARIKIEETEYQQIAMSSMEETTMEKVGNQQNNITTVERNTIQTLHRLKTIAKTDDGLLIIIWLLVKNRIASYIIVSTEMRRQIEITTILKTIGSIPQVENMI